MATKEESLKQIGDLIDQGFEPTYVHFRKDYKDVWINSDRETQPPNSVSTHARLISFGYSGRVYEAEPLTPQEETSA